MVVHGMILDTIRCDVCQSTYAMISTYNARTGNTRCKVTERKWLQLNATECNCAIDINWLISRNKFRSMVLVIYPPFPIYKDYHSARNVWGGNLRHEEDQLDWSGAIQHSPTLHFGVYHSLRLPWLYQFNLGRWLMKGLLESKTRLGSMSIHVRVMTGSLAWLAWSIQNPDFIWKIKV